MKTKKILSVTDAIHNWGKRFFKSYEWYQTRGFIAIGKNGATHYYDAKYVIDRFRNNRFAPATKLVLPSGLRYGYDSQGNKVCVGTYMGRRNILPTDPKAPVKLRMERLKWVDGDYDQWGAYWGNSGTGSIYCAFAYEIEQRMSVYPTALISDFETDTLEVCIFVRALSREQAKELVRIDVPNAKFFI